MLHFLLGAAVIVAPRGNLALLAAIGAVKGAGECLASVWTLWCRQPVTDCMHQHILCTLCRSPQPRVWASCCDDHRCDCADTCLNAGALKRRVSKKKTTQEQGGEDGAEEQEQQGGVRSSTPDPKETVGGRQSDICTQGSCGAACALLQPRAAPHL